MFFEDDGFTMSLLNIPHNHAVHSHGEYQHFGPKPIENENRAVAIAFKMQFLNSSNNTKLTGFETYNHKVNYFLGKDNKRWQHDLSVFKNLTYFNIYSGINIEYYGLGDQLKYDIHLEAFADPSIIQFTYYGLKSTEIKEGKLLLKTELGNLIESIPEAYQIINEQKVIVKCQYQIKDDIIGFKLGNYDKSYPLVIDPVLDFSTFSGSADLNFGHSATPSINGGTYAAGVNFGSNYPTTVGSFQEDFASDSIFNVDVTISKFSADGTRLEYATYLGGNDIDVVFSLIADEFDNLYIFGTTGSSDFPLSQNPFQSDFKGGPFLKSFAFNDFNNGTDLFISKLSSDGSRLLASTYWGGSENDGLNSIVENYGDEFKGEIILNNNGDVAVVSSTKSTDVKFTILSNEDKTSDDQDAIIGLFTPDLESQLWGSYYGGDSMDGGYTIKSNGQKIFIAGGSASSNLPVSNPNIQNTNAGLLDGFVASFSSLNGNLLNASYYGTDTTDQIFLMDIDYDGHIYLFGQSKGSISISSNQYGTVGATQFIVKIDTSLSNILWETTIGSGQAKQDLVPSAFMVDDCKNIYLSGWNGAANVLDDGSQNGNTLGLSHSSDAFQSATDGSDFYFMILGADASSLLYASFLGGADNEHVDGGTSRFSKDGTIHQAVCTNCQNKGFPTTGDSYSPNAGNTSCNMAVFKFSFEQLLEAEAEIAFTTEVDTTCDALIVDFDNYSINATNYKWLFGTGDSSTLEKPSYTFYELGVYTVHLIAYDTLCGVVDTAQITIEHTDARFPDAHISAQYQDCDTEFRVELNASKSSRANSYKWLIGSTEVNTGDLNYQFDNEGPHTVFLVAHDSVCNRSDTTFEIIYFQDTIPSPYGDVNVSSCSNGEIDAEVSNHRNWYSYEWITEGNIYYGESPNISYDLPGIKTVDLKITDTLCNKYFEHSYTVNLNVIKRDLHIPNAFSPNNDGLNDNFEIFGDECTQGDCIKIFSRWGEIVFESDKPYAEFWNGQIDHQNAPSGVYTYILITNEDRVQGSFVLLR